MFIFYFCEWFHADKCDHAPMHLASSHCSWGHADDVIHGPDWRQLLKDFDSKWLSCSANQQVTKVALVQYDLVAVQIFDGSSNFVGDNSNLIQVRLLMSVHISHLTPPGLTRTWSSRPSPWHLRPNRQRRRSLRHGKGNQLTWILWSTSTM